MIKPDKFTDPYNCVVYDSYILLKLLRTKKRVLCKDLYDYLLDKVGESADVLFVPAMDFLFLLNKITYNEITDFVELKI